MAKGCKKKILVVGGVESVPYKELGGKIDVCYVPHRRPFNASAIVYFDAIVCLVPQISHAAAKAVKKLATKNNVPIYYLSSSGATRFRAFVEEIFDVN